MDQRIDGGKWNPLGRYEFTEGWNTIYVSRSTPLANGQHIVADALRIRGNF